MLQQFFSSAPMPTLWLFPTETALVRLRLAYMSIDFMMMGDAHELQSLVIRVVVGIGPDCAVVIHNAVPTPLASVHIIRSLIFLVHGLHGDGGQLYGRRLIHINHLIVPVINKCMLVKFPAIHPMQWTIQQHLNLPSCFLVGVQHAR